jgi:succinate dehydrogenase flavin-adding protein (antitoxin of CptAB toxin-antitoxin module)
MINYDDLHAQNHRITELTNVLHVLMTDRTLLDSDITCEIFFRYVEQVKDHLEVTDREMYSTLLKNGDNDVTQLANMFMSGSQEIKKMFDSYLKKWCKLNKKTLAIKNHDDFVVETEEMFNMMLNRIQDETEKLYPVVRKVTGDEIKAA